MAFLLAIAGFIAVAEGIHARGHVASGTINQESLPIEASEVLTTAPEARAPQLGESPTIWQNSHSQVTKMQGLLSHHFVVTHGVDALKRSSNGFMPFVPSFDDGSDELLADDSKPQVLTAPVLSDEKSWVSDALAQSPLLHRYQGVVAADIDHGHVHSMGSRPRLIDRIFEEKDAGESQPEPPQSPNLYGIPSPALPDHSRIYNPETSVIEARDVIASQPRLIARILAEHDGVESRSPFWVTGDMLVDSPSKSFHSFAPVVDVQADVMSAYSVADNSSNLSMKEETGKVSTTRAQSSEAISSRQDDENQLLIANISPLDTAADSSVAGRMRNRMKKSEVADDDKNPQEEFLGVLAP